MKKLSIYYYIFFLNFFVSLGQEIKFYSFENNKPLKNVLVFDSKGLLVTNSDENGTIDEKSLLKNEPYFIAYYNNIVQDTIRLNDIKANAIYLDTKIINLSEVIVSKQGVNSDVIVVEGYFNNIITNNKRVTGYIEGIVQYLFDYKSKKYKDKKLIQYRIFKVKNSKMNDTDMETYDIDSYKLPEIKKISDINSLKGKYTYSENNDNQGFKNINLKKVLVNDENTLKMFGFVFTNFYEVINASYNSSNLNINNLTLYSSIESVNIKRKAEVKYSCIQKIINFYPTNIYFLMNNEAKALKEISLDKSYSKYSSLFWEFIPMFKNEKNYSPLSFIEGLKEIENKK